MAFNALNSAAPMNMPDFEDASPAQFQPDGTSQRQPVGVFAALQNAREIFEGEWTTRPYDVVKKGQSRSYKINNTPAKWPTRFVRPPGIHLRFDSITVDDEPVPGTIAVATLWVLNNYDALKRAGTGVYFYVPKIQTPREAVIIEKLLSRLEDVIGVPAGTFKIKVLYEEGNAGRSLVAVAWVRTAVAQGNTTPVPRAILHADSVLDLPSLGTRFEMPFFVFQGALDMVTPGMRNGEPRNGGANRGMAAVMIYPSSDPCAVHATTGAAGDGDRQAARAAAQTRVRAGRPAAAASSRRSTTSWRIASRAGCSTRIARAGSRVGSGLRRGHNAPLQAPFGCGGADAPQWVVDVKGKQVPAAARSVTRSGACYSRAACSARRARSRRG
jgi:hypothetical protein